MFDLISFAPTAQPSGNFLPICLALTLEFSLAFKFFSTVTRNGVLYLLVFLVRTVNDGRKWQQNKRRRWKTNRKKSSRFGGIKYYIIPTVYQFCKYYTLSVYQILPLKIDETKLNSQLSFTCFFRKNSCELFCDSRFRRQKGSGNFAQSSKSVKIYARQSEGP